MSSRFCCWLFLWCCCYCCCCRCCCSVLSVSTSLSVIKFLFLFVCHISIIYSVYICILCVYIIFLCVRLYINIWIFHRYSEILRYNWSYTCCEIYIFRVYNNTKERWRWWRWSRQGKRNDTRTHARTHHAKCEDFQIYCDQNVKYWFWIKIRKLCDRERRSEVSMKFRHQRSHEWNYAQIEISFENLNKLFPLLLIFFCIAFTLHFIAPLTRKWIWSI